VLGLRIHTDTQIAPILGWLRERIDLCGTPLALMSDNDARFVFWIPGVLTRFGKTLEELRIRHIRTQVKLALDQRQGRAALGNAAGRGPRSPDLPLAGRGRGGPHGLRQLLQLSPAARRDRLVHPGRAL
jgi:hypothetical protein